MEGTRVPTLEGTQIGAYRMVHQIGEGGMGTVWLAEHSMLGRRAAVKVLHPMFSGRQDIVTRFFNEARAATAISDPGIVQIFDFGHHTDGTAYIVMELLEGEPLDQRLDRQGRFAVGDALRILRQVASALGAAHAHGIVHRDLKPENIFLVRDPEVVGGERAKILDFGIAKLTGDHVGVKTQTSAVMGTPTYMSPEQCRGAGGVDQRSDIYALGCVLFALLTGQPPFNALGAGELIVMHLTEPAPRVSSRVPGVSPAVDDLIARCLEKDPARRFSSGAELAAAIGAQLGQPWPTPAPPPGFVTGSQHPVSALPTTLSGSAGVMPMPSSSPPRRKHAIVGIGIGVALAIAGIATFAAMHGQADEAPAPTGAPAPSHPANNVAPAPAPVPAPVRDDKPELAKANLRAVLTAFTRWSPSHAGAPCPSAADLVGNAPQLDDPWGHPITVTCTDQPAQQVIGVVSAGPDGTSGTADDIASWQLGTDVTGIVRGPRWVATPPAVAATKPTPVAKKPTRTTSPTHTTNTTSDPKKPSSSVQLDENGIPLQR
jgi:serine/threonine protein kinase